MAPTFEVETLELTGKHIGIAEASTFGNAPDEMTPPAVISASWSGLYVWACRQVARILS